MAAWEQQPEAGQKFWQEGTGSGKITYVSYGDKEIIVDFYEKGSRTYEFDEVLGNWQDIHGGTWTIYNI